jgi:hypothetical protein
MMSKSLDYPIEECAKAMQPFLDAGCHFHQKFTCEKCGTRQTIAKADQWFATGSCEACEHVTDIRKRGCNYLLAGPPGVIAAVKYANAKIPHVIRVVAFANGAPCSIAGQWLKSFDFNASNGVGSGEFTDNWRKAKRFESQADAVAYWNTVATVRPLRADGLPNKPLTATTCQIESEQQARKWAQDHRSRS